MFNCFLVVQHQSYYRIESNSQPRCACIAKRCSCTTSKLLQNWKQFTTGERAYAIIPGLYNIKVITELKAIHNSSGSGCTPSGLYNIKVITELKAIHNALSVALSRSEVVQHQSYYRIESNSQPTRAFTDGTFSCTTSKLLQNWKQFTTRCAPCKRSSLLYNIKVITELKAIHNTCSYVPNPKSVVQHQSYYRIESNSQLNLEGLIRLWGCTTSKLLQNWKQFTTWSWGIWGQTKLYNIKVITELKAIHNRWFAVSRTTKVVQHQSYYRIESNSQLL